MHKHSGVLWCCHNCRPAPDAVVKEAKADGQILLPLKKSFDSLINSTRSIVIKQEQDPRSQKTSLEVLGINAVTELSVINRKLSVMHLKSSLLIVEFVRLHLVMWSSEKVTCSNNNCNYHSQVLQQIYQELDIFSTFLSKSSSFSCNAKSLAFKSQM